jgi:hypothetical protein
MSIERNFSLQFCVGILLLVAFMAQSIIPAGFMPSFQTGKTFHITICQGADQIDIEVDTDMNPVQKSDHTTGKKSPCLYTSLAGGFLSTQDFVLSQLTYLIYEEAVERDSGFIQPTPSTHQYLAQAPPYILG